MITPQGITSWIVATAVVVSFIVCSIMLGLYIYSPRIPIDIYVDNFTVQYDGQNVIYNATINKDTQLRANYPYIIHFIGTESHAANP